MVQGHKRKKQFFSNNFIRNPWWSQENHIRSLFEIRGFGLRDGDHYSSFTLVWKNWWSSGWFIMIVKGSVRCSERNICISIDMATGPGNFFRFSRHRQCLTSDIVILNCQPPLACTVMSVMSGVDPQLKESLSVITSTDISTYNLIHEWQLHRERCLQYCVLSVYTWCISKVRRMILYLWENKLDARACIEIFIGISTRMRFHGYL